MASRKTIAPSTLKDTSSDTKSTRSRNSTSKASNSGLGKKTGNTVGKQSGNVVKSRYLQSGQKSSLSKSNSLTNDTVTVPLRPSSPKPSGVKPKLGMSPRRSLAPQALGMSMLSCEADPSLEGKSVLQSTFSDGHCFGPDFDISAIKDKTVITNAVEAVKNQENDKRFIEMQAFQLAYLVAKMENNTAKLKAEAEARLLQVMEEEEALRKEVHEKKRRYLLMEKNRQMNNLLDLQISALTPLAEASYEFTETYKVLATAVDTTRHELPVKNFYIEGDRREFLDKAEARLKESENLLNDCIEGDQKDNSATLECLKDMKMTSNAITQELSRAFSELQELSSLVCRHTTQVQQAAEEEQLSTERAQELFCPKH